MIREIENEFKELIENIHVDVIDEEVTEEDVVMWGYEDLEDFWESNI